MPFQRMLLCDSASEARTVKAYELEQDGWDKAISHRENAERVPRVLRRSTFGGPKGQAQWLPWWI